MESDLKALSAINILFKYADDTNLLVSEKTDIDMSKEFENILQWAADNDMIVNTNNTKEIVFHRPSAWHSLPIPLIGIEQVLSVKLLGVTVSHNMKFDEHVKMFWLFVASATIYWSVLKVKVYLQRSLTLCFVQLL